MIRDGSEVQSLERFELCFENCESVIIDPKAVKALQFIMTGQTAYFDMYRTEMHFDKMVGSVYIRLDVSNPEWFTRPACQKDFDDRQTAMERVIYSDDITRLYINYVRYDVPYLTKEDRAKAGTDFDKLTHDMFANKYQTIEMRPPLHDGHSEVIIRISEISDIKYADKENNDENSSET